VAGHGGSKWQFYWECGLFRIVNMSFDLFFQEKSHVFRVSELNFAIKQLLESNVPLLWVRGEISNLVKAASGHFYFSLKDDQAQVRCVMFRQKSQMLKQSLVNGQQVEVSAVATLYEQRGDFQLIVEQVRPAGLGILYERFEQLKKSLQSEGLFAPERKRSLPVFPKRIGIITSPQAAALRDVLTTISRRMPSVPVVLYPTPVQGNGSAEKIMQAIQIANKRLECDVLILCRGGGSIEDLWSFNEEIVARAIATSDIPIVSGVGHCGSSTRSAGSPCTARQFARHITAFATRTAQPFEQRHANHGLFTAQTGASCSANATSVTAIGPVAAAHQAHQCLSTATPNFDPAKYDTTAARIKQRLRLTARPGNQFGATFCQGDERGEGTVVCTSGKCRSASCLA
jgi:hypothetical protein